MKRLSPRRDWNICYKLMDKCTLYLASRSTVLRIIRHKTYMDIKHTYTDRVV